MKKSTQANYALLFISMLWGASYPIVRMSAADIGSATFVLLRFGLAALCLLPLGRAGLHNAAVWRIGAALGLLEGVVCALLTYNIASMPASRCAFIVGTSVVMVPVWSAIFGASRLRLMDVGRALLSLGGLYMVTGADVHGLGRAEGWAALAAALWALNIVILRQQTRRHRVDSTSLAFCQSLFTCLPPLAMLVAYPVLTPHFSTKAVLGLAYVTFFATVVSLVIQNKFQKHTTATQAGLRLGLDPFFATVFATLFFGEAAKAGIFIGGPMMLLATVLPELLALLKARFSATGGHLQTALQQARRGKLAHRRMQLPALGRRKIASYSSHTPSQPIVGVRAAT